MPCFGTRCAAAHLTNAPARPSTSLKCLQVLRSRCYCTQRESSPLRRETCLRSLTHRLRYKLSFRDIAEFFLLQGFEFSHETVRDWEERFASIFVDQLRAKRQGKVGTIWSVDETYIRVKGKWCYLDRGIDQDGNLVDVRLSEKRDMEAAIAFFAQTYKIAEEMPERVVSDGHTSYLRAIAEELGAEVEHEVKSYLENPLE